MIRVAVVDDHPAVRVGLEAVVETQPDLTSVGAAADAGELAPLLYRTAPDVVVLDYRLTTHDGLELCRRIKSEPPAPGVIIHSAFADEWLTVPAMLAGADGVVHKGAPARELAEAVRTVAEGATWFRPVRPAQLLAAAQALDASDRPILAMLVHGTPTRDVAATLGLEPGELAHRLAGMLATLRGGAVPPAA